MHKSLGLASDTLPTGTASPSRPLLVGDRCDAGPSPTLHSAVVTAASNPGWKQAMRTRGYAVWNWHGQIAPSASVCDCRFSILTCIWALHPSPPSCSHFRTLSTSRQWLFPFADQDRARLSCPPATSTTQRSLIKAGNLWWSTSPPGRQGLAPPCASTEKRNTNRKLSGRRNHVPYSSNLLHIINHRWRW